MVIKSKILGDPFVRSPKYKKMIISVIWDLSTLNELITNRVFWQRPAELYYRHNTKSSERLLLSPLSTDPNLLKKGLKCAKNYKIKQFWSNPVSIVLWNEAKKVRRWSKFLRSKKCIFSTAIIGLTGLRKINVIPIGSPCGL